MLDQVWTRRALLRTSLIGPSAVLALLDRVELLARELPGELSLYNPYSDEWLEVCDRDPGGRGDRRALAALTRRDPPPQPTGS